MGNSYTVIFSYKTTGNGNNNFISRVKKHLEDAEIAVEMKHGSADDEELELGQEQQGNSKTIYFQEWFLHWKDVANKADKVVLFDTDRWQTPRRTAHGDLDGRGGMIGYSNSKGCQAENRYAKQHCSYISVGRMIDGGATSEEVADAIARSLQ